MATRFAQAFFILSQGHVFYRFNNELVPQIVKALNDWIVNGGEAYCPEGSGEMIPPTLNFSGYKPMPNNQWQPVTVVIPLGSIVAIEFVSDTAPLTLVS